VLQSSASTPTRRLCSFPVRLAWKLKRAVQYDYLDFSTAELRRLACEAEVRVNRRAAPTLYRGVVAVTRQADGSLALGTPAASSRTRVPHCDRRVLGIGQVNVGSSPGAGPWRRSWCRAVPKR
jgi:hypothetical protein